MSFLDQLQQSAGLLSNQVQSVNPFGDYSPTLASDYVSGVPQNRFVGNQFQMPSLGSGVVQQPTFATPNVGSNFGTYTPSPFISPSTSTVTTTQPNIMPVVPGNRGGVQGEGPQYSKDPVTGKMVSISKDPSNQAAIESIGGMNLKINPITGSIEILDPESLTSKLHTGINEISKYTPSGLLSSLFGRFSGTTDYGRNLDRIRNQYGDDIADEIAATVRETYGKATPTGLLAGGLTPGTKLTVGNTPGFINSRGEFQGGTDITNLSNINMAPDTVVSRPNMGPPSILNPPSEETYTFDAEDLRQTIAALPDNKGSGKGFAEQSIGGFTGADATRESFRGGNYGGFK
jgi:hypothetical protein